MKGPMNGPTDGHETKIVHPEHYLLKRANEVNAPTDGWKHDRYQAISYARWENDREFKSNLFLIDMFKKSSYSKINYQNIHRFSRLFWASFRTTTRSFSSTRRWFITSADPSLVCAKGIGDGSSEFDSIWGSCIISLIPGKKVNSLNYLFFYICFSRLDLQNFD